MTLLELIRLILRNKKAVIIIPLTVMLIVFLSTSKKPMKYKSYTTVYTGFASGYSVENGEKNKIDFHAINVAFDNVINVVKARETKEEVALRLLAKHITLNGKADKTVSQGNLDRIKEILPDSILKKVYVKDSPERTFLNLLKIKQRDEKNAVYTIVNDETEPYYSTNSIKEIRVTRVESSDMVKLEFETTDPGICQDVLNIMSDVFIRKFRGIKQGETTNVSEFFEIQTKQAYDRLNAAEEKLKEFRSENRVINYYEQTKFISEKREDLIDEMNKEKMILTSAQAAVKNSEEKLGASKKILNTSSDILNLRNKISELNSKILLLEVDKTTTNIQDINKLKNTLQDLKNDLDQKVTSLFSSNISKEGINHKEIAKIWIENTITTDESNARIPIYENRLQEIENTYDQFAPLGSNLNKMEREIGIAEKEYLNHLASLNAARLRENNLQMSSNLQVVDMAFYPLKPLPNDRFLLIIISVVSSLIVTVASLFAFEVLDQTVKTPQRAEKITNKSILGAYPLINKKTIKIQNDGHLVKMTNDILFQINQNLKQRFHNKNTYVISVCSNREKDGKSFIISQITEQLKTLNKRFVVLSPDIQTESNLTIENKITFPINGDFYDKEHYEQLLTNHINSNDYQYIIIELPPFFNYKPSQDLINSIDLNLFILKADRLWEQADDHSFKHIFSEAKSQTLVTLNHVDWHILEQYIGELDLKGGKFRKLIKKWIKLDFRN
ncbi:MAG: GumC family protein [Sphingobacteriaceae bacterium]